MSALAQKITAKLHHEIPISQQMGFEVRELSDWGARAVLPLSLNHNHLNTQFGGSLYAAGALTCYSALLGLLDRSGLGTNNIVISEGHIDYIAPGQGDVELVANLPTDEIEEFCEKLRHKGRARMKIETEIRNGSTLVARVRGEYLVRA